MATRFEPDEEGLREFLRTSPPLRAHLEQLAAKGVDYGRQIAPVGDQDDPHAGAYRDSLHAEINVGPTRMSARIVSDDPKRYWIEYGAAHTPKFAVLRRALDHAMDTDSGDYGGIETYTKAPEHRHRGGG